VMKAPRTKTYVGFQTDNETENRGQKDNPTHKGGVYRCFWINNRTSFDYYKHDQTRNPRICCVIFYKKIHECSSYS